MTVKTYPIPSFYSPANAEAWDYQVDLSQLLVKAADWKRQHGIKASGSDKKRVCLLWIDDQNDFCLPRGTLFVGGRSGRGAIDDTDRQAQFAYRNIGVITDIFPTFDTHFLFQIFFQSFLLDDQGNYVAPFREILTEDVIKGRVKPNPAMVSWLCGGSYAWLCKQLEHYCRELEKSGKYKLIVWPFHTMLGTPGHNMVGVLHEARMFHAAVRGSQTNGEIKGGHPMTENYSILRPEVLTRWDGKALAQKNARFFQILMSYDVIVVMGQAGSHCVASTTDDLLAEVKAIDPALASKVYVATDCMSAVTVPDGKGGFYADYTPQMEAAFQRYADAGMHLVKSTDPIESWPGIQL